MQRIGIEEVHHRVLAIAKEFDRICSSHGIPYYMLGGTMLGAIRHKGFIPWDDDMDFGVPIEHYKALFDLLERDLPFPYRACSFKNHPAVLHNFIKIEDRTTCIEDPFIALSKELQLGVNIDVFPLCICSLGGKEEKKIRKMASTLGIYLNSPNQSHRWALMIKNGILRVLTGGSPIYLQNRIENKLFSIHQGNALGNLLGRWGDKEIVPIEWYGTGTRYVFEDTSFIGLENYDAYLSRLYGDYMSLPPKEQQVAHVDNFYLR